MDILKEKKKERKERKKKKNLIEILLCLLFLIKKTNTIDVSYRFSEASSIKIISDKYQ